MARIVDASIGDPASRSLQEVVKRYAFGPFVLDAQRSVVALGDGAPLPLGPRVVATLAALVERAGAVVTKDELLDLVWGSADVGESNVAQSVYTLRKVLHAHGLDGSIATVPRRGYRFTAAVTLLPDAVPRTSRAAPAVVGSPSPSEAGRRGVWGAWRLVAAAAAAATLLAVGAVPAARRATPPPLSARGTELYRLARYYWNLRTPATLAKSARLFAAVVATDPRNPLGHAGQADADMMLADYGRPNARVAVLYARARREARAALALDPSSAAAHTSLAMVRSAADHDVAGSFVEFRRAIALDPDYAVAHHWYGIMLFQQGRLSEASRELHRAIELDPVSAATSAWLAEASYFGHRYADAITYSRRALDLDPHRGGALERLGLAYELAGDLPDAIAAFRRMAGSRDAAEAPGLLAEAYARAGKRGAAHAALRIAERLRPHDGDTAFALLAIGQRARGLAILGHMDRRRVTEDSPLPDPRLDPFRAALPRRYAIQPTSTG